MKRVEKMQFFDKLFDRKKAGIDSHLNTGRSMEAQKGQEAADALTACHDPCDQEHEYKPPNSEKDVPLIPCTAVRLNWETLVRIDLNAFRSDDVLIAFSSDIRQSINNLGRLKSAGRAVYRSPSFGWLREEKEAVVFKIDRQIFPEGQEMERFENNNYLEPLNLSSDNTAFFVENGEKEYSAEIVAITDGKVSVLFRYTIGGPDEIKNTFEPELLNLRLD